jgi:hypothetical protein
MANVKFVLLVLCFFSLSAKAAVHSGRPLHQSTVVAIAP